MKGCQDLIKKKVGGLTENTPAPSLFLFLFLILAAVGFRVYLASSPRGYWYDEIISLEMAQEPLLSSWQYLKTTHTPPLHVYLLRGWGKVFGFREISTRLLSILLGSSGILGFYLLGKEFFDRRTGLVAALVYASSPFSLYFSSEVRAYGLLFSLNAFSLYFFWRWENKKAGGWEKAGYFLTTLAALYTHLTALVLLLIQTVFLLLKKGGRKERLLLLLLLFFLFTPWLFFFLSKKTNDLKAGLLRRSWYFGAPDYSSSFFALFQDFLVFGSELPLFGRKNPLLGLLILSILLPALFKRKKDGSFLFLPHREIPFLLLGLFLPLLPLCLGTVPESKFYLTSATAFYVLFARGLVNLARDYDFLSRPRFIAFSLFLASVFVFPRFPLLKNLDTPWHHTPRVLEKADPDLVVTNRVSIVPVSFYLEDQKQVPVLALAPFPGGRDSDDLAYSLRYNWILFSPPTKKEEEKIRKQVEEGVREETESILYIKLHPHVSRAKKTEEILEEEGFERVKKFSSSEKTQIENLDFVLMKRRGRL